MNAATASRTELANLKAKLKATWMSGDFDKIAEVIWAGGAEFILGCLFGLGIDLTSQCIGHRLVIGFYRGLCGVG